MGDAKNRAALAAPTRLWDVDLREATDTQAHSTVVQRREAFLRRQCGVTGPLAAVLAEHAFSIAGVR